MSSAFYKYKAEEERGSGGFPQYVRRRAGYLPDINRRDLQHSSPGLLNLFKFRLWRRVFCLAWAAFMAARCWAATSSAAAAAASESPGLKITSTPIGAWKCY